MSARTTIPVSRLRPVLEQWVRESGGEIDRLAHELVAGGAFSAHASAVRRLSSYLRGETEAIEVGKLDDLLVAMDEQWRLDELTRGLVCAGCGIAYGKRTVNCPVCQRRHSIRCARGLAHVRPRCKGCRCRYDRRTIGCPACKSRHWLRRHAGREYAPTKPRERCTACGCRLAERTRGCHTCIARHWQRRQRRVSHERSAPLTETRAPLTTTGG